MNYLVRCWRSLWHQDVVVGDPDHEITWIYQKYDDHHDYPPFDLGQLVRTEGGWRLLLFRWLVLVDPWQEEGIYQPLVWVEYVPAGGKEGEVRGRHLAVHLVKPSAKGRKSFLFPLSLQAYRELGPWRTHWEDWTRPAFEDGISV